MSQLICVGEKMPQMIGIQKKRERERERDSTEEVVEGKEDCTAKESLGIKIGGGKKARKK